MKICIINFSGRVGGNCKQIADFICEKYKGEDVKHFGFNRINLTPCGKNIKLMKAKSPMRCF